LKFESSESALYGGLRPRADNVFLASADEDQRVPFEAVEQVVLAPADVTPLEREVVGVVEIDREAGCVVAGLAPADRAQRRDDRTAAGRGRRLDTELAPLVGVLIPSGTLRR
jgi:hypothetical protein